MARNYMAGNLLDDLIEETDLWSMKSFYILNIKKEVSRIGDINNLLLKSWCNFEKLHYENKSVLSRLETHCIWGEKSIFVYIGYLDLNEYNCRAANQPNKFGKDQNSGHFRVSCKKNWKFVWKVVKINEYYLNFSLLLYGALMLIKVLRCGGGVKLIVDSTRFWPKLCQSLQSLSSMSMCLWAKRNLNFR